MAPAAESYRRLPGRQRGIVGGSSLWMGSDHILLVRSSWFREEYKRFYLRDIQAIVIAAGPRFHISLPILIFALVWLFPGFGIMFWPAAIQVVWVLGTLAMAATWLSISIASSCRCRLYTAVSRDDLPSLYRTWTARKFLNRVKPLIDQVQGVVDSAWAEAERSHVGPAFESAAMVELPTKEAKASKHTLASDLFILSLFVGALGDFSVAHFASTGWVRLRTGLTILQLAAAIVVLVQYRRGRLARAMQRVAIASLAVTGLMFYVQSISMSLVAATSPAAAMNRAIFVPEPLHVVYQITGGLRVLLGVLGLGILVRGGPRDQPDIIKN